MFRLFHIREHQRGLWFRRGDFQDVLMPGSTWLLHPADTVEIVDTLVTRFEHKLLDVLIDKPQVRAQLEIVDLGAMERAIVWKDGRLFQILAPGRHAFWKTSARLEIDSISAGLNVNLPRRRTFVFANYMYSNQRNDANFELSPGE